jgi:hypothetical protein
MKPALDDNALTPPGRAIRNIMGLTYVSEGSPNQPHANLTNSVFAEPNTGPGSRRLQQFGRWERSGDRDRYSNARTSRARPSIGRKFFAEAGKASSVVQVLNLCERADGAIDHRSLLGVAYLGEHVTLPWQERPRVWEVSAPSAARADKRTRLFDTRHNAGI